MLHGALELEPQGRCRAKAKAKEEAYGTAFYRVVRAPVKRIKKVTVR
jgi:hypothetical protein